MGITVGNFKQSAEFFEAQAEKATHSLTKERLAERARFYRDLAAITPNFPKGYKLQLGTFANRWRNRAEECRAMAEWFKDDPICRTQLFALAETYERLADEQEKNPTPIDNLRTGGIRSDRSPTRLRSELAALLAPSVGAATLFHLNSRPVLPRESPTPPIPACGG